MAPICSRFYCLLSLAILNPNFLYAQVNRTSITGTVTDQQGHRIPQCRVHAKEAATGFERATQTTSQGTYDLAGLPPGIYTVEFQKDGFAVFSVRNLEQLVG